MLVASVLLLIIFRQHPTLVITTVAGCLVIVTVYLAFTTVGNVNDTFQ
jgi:ABC-type protease/lipase transport system fused ATPase/permease subunit